jgi:hypothetical protein
MKRWLKITLWSVGIFIFVIAALMATFIYKIKNGFPVSYETEIPSIDFPEGKTTVLLFSKARPFVTMNLSKLVRMSLQILPGKIIGTSSAPKKAVYSTKNNLTSLIL